MGGSRKAPASHWWKRALRPAQLEVLLPGLRSCLARFMANKWCFTCLGMFMATGLASKIVGLQVHVSRTRYLLGYLRLVISWGRQRLHVRPKEMGASRRPT